MTYQKPELEIIRFEDNVVFMTASTYENAGQALAASCTGYNGGATNNFTCSDFGGYNANNPPTQNAQVTIGGGTYVFDYKGNHWKLHNGN